MGGRLWALLALLGAAGAVDWCVQWKPCANGGTCSMVGSAWICHCPSRWRGKRCQTGLGPAELTEPPPPRPLSSLSSGRGSWDPGTLSRAPTWHRTMAVSEAVGRDLPESPGPLRSSGQSRPALSATPMFMRPSTAPAGLSVSASPAGASGHGSSPSSLSVGVSTERPPGVWWAMSPSQASGNRVQEDTHSHPPEPRNEATWAPGMVNPASQPGVQEAGAEPSPTEVPATGAPLPGAFWTTGSTETPEQDWAAPGGLARRGSAAPQTVGPAGSKAYAESWRKPGLYPAPPRPTVGPLLPDTALLESPAPPGWSGGPELPGVEDVAPGDPVGPAAPHNMSLGQRTSVWEWQGPTPPPSAGVRGSEATPHLTTPPSYAATAATFALSPDFLPSRTERPSDAGHLTPSPSQPLSHWGLPPGEAEAVGAGQDARWSSTSLPTSTGRLAEPSTEPLRVPGPHNASVIHKLTEPFGTPSALAHSSPGPMRDSPRWVTSSYRPSGPRGTPAAGTGRADLSADSQKKPLTATPAGGFPHKAALSQASQPVGGTTETQEPPVHLPRRKGAAAIPGSFSPTESPMTSSASAAFAARESSSAHSGAPPPPSQTALSSSSTSTTVAMPTSPAGKTVTLDLFSVTPQAWSAPARTWRWSRGEHPTESPLHEAPHSRPMPTTGNAWYTWPPARGDPPVASTWLLAVVPEAVTQVAPAMPREVRPRAQRIFVVENQPPVLKAALLHLPWELVLAMEFPRSLGSPHSPEYQGLVRSINATVAPLFAPLPGFQHLEVRSIRPSLRRRGGVVVLLDALFLVEAPGWWAALKRAGLPEPRPPGLRVANTSVVWSMALERPLDLCAELFLCPTGYDCLVGNDGNATCASVCHRQYCKNQGICTHAVNQTPICQCPVGSDFWFLGVRCDYKVTQQGLLGVVCGLLLSLLVIGAAIFGLVVRRVRMLLLEARADQTKSSYRRFCRLDDVSAHYWSEPWLASVSSLDNPAFSNSEELLHLQILEPAHCGCQEGCLAAEGHRKPPPQGPPSRGAAGRPRSFCSWEQSSASGNEHMVDSGKASEVSVSSWPLEPIQWSPSPALHQHSRPPTHKSRRPHSYCEGMELINLERSWTA